MYTKRTETTQQSTPLGVNSLLEKMMKTDNRNIALKRWKWKQLKTNTALQDSEEKTRFKK